MLLSRHLCAARQGSRDGRYLWKMAVMSEKSSPVVKAVLEVTEVKKAYGPTLALTGVDMTLYPGQVHALMGENGAGKSTLVRILVGATRPSGGAFRLNGKRVNFHSVSDAIKAGIVPIYQHLTLFNELSVLENLYSFDTASTGLLPPYLGSAAAEMAKASLARVGLSVSLEQKVSTLKLGERQLLEIARGLQRNCTVLLLDEPTAALNAHEADRLLEVIRGLAAEGVAILYISHKSDEIRKVADVVTVLRDGRSVICGAPLKDTSVDDLVNAMLGHAFAVVDKQMPIPGEIVLEAKQMVLVPGGAPVSFAVAAGEVLGVIGLVGSGAEEIGQALAGARGILSGSIAIDGQLAQPYSRRDAVRRGVGYVPPDRHEDGLFELHSALSNASASILKTISKYFFVQPKKEKASFSSRFQALALNPNEPNREIQHFSGGNQQKVLVARNLVIAGLKILVLTEPTRGVDVGARDKIHDAIVEATHAGQAVVLITTDLEELTSLAHRTLIVRNGQIVRELPQFSSPDDVALAMLEQE